MAATKLNLGAYAESTEWARRAIEANRNHPLAHLWLAAALAQLGRLDEARRAVQPGIRFRSRVDFGRGPRALS